MAPCPVPLPTSLSLSLSLWLRPSLLFLSSIPIPSPVNGVICLTCSSTFDLATHLDWDQPAHLVIARQPGGPVRLCMQPVYTMRFDINVIQLLLLLLQMKRLKWRCRENAAGALYNTHRKRQSMHYIRKKTQWLHSIIYLFSYQGCRPQSRLKFSRKKSSTLLN